MKKIVFIVVCIVGITCFTSCRSTSKPCGLGDNAFGTPMSFEQIDVS
ncbi:MAG: hypothetical protein P8Q33_05680 [Polaribacter sp.]|nr:hypothetical protein [Polaribacter sp.]